MQQAYDRFIYLAYEENNMQIIGKKSPATSEIIVLLEN